MSELLPILDARYTSLASVGYSLGPVSALARFRKAKARVRAGEGRGLVVGQEDSTGFAKGAGTGALLLNGARVKAKLYRTAQILSAKGLPALCEGTLGNGALGTTAELVAYDSRLTIPSPWVFGGSNNIIPGSRTLRNNTDATALSLTPAISVDSFRAFYLANTGTGTFTLDIDGGATTASTAASGKVFGSVVKTGALGTHTLNVKRVSGDTYICGFMAWNSAVPAVDFINAGWAGSTITDWMTSTSSPWDPTAAIVSLAADAVVLNLSINSMVAGIAVATYIAALSTEIDTLKAASDVIVWLPNWLDPGIVSPATQVAYRSALIDLATTKGCAIVDGAFGYADYAAALADTAMADTLHPTALGYAVPADPLASLLLAA